MSKDRSGKRILKIVITVVFFLFIIIYGFFRSADLIFGVKIKDVNITDGQKFDQSVIELTGIAKNAVYLTVNGREISVDKAGNFRENVALASGYNIITLEAKDKFGHVDIEDYKLIY